LLDHTLRKALFSIGTIIGKAILAIALVLLIYGAWFWWDMHRLRSFCGDLHVGTPVADIRGIAERHWISARYVHGNGVYDEKTHSWFLPIPAPSTMGDMVCAIHHNNGKVVSAEIWGP
jgi:hypothetical protein